MENEIKIYKKQSVIGIDGKPIEILIQIGITSPLNLENENKMLNQEKIYTETRISENLLKQDLIKNIGDLDYIILP